MELKIEKVHPEAKIPVRAYEGDAGMDLFSVEEVSIAPGANYAVATGLKMAIPAGYAGFVWDKSGLALKQRIKTMAGVIDANYRGEVKVVLLNLNTEPYLVEKGSKVGQLVVTKVEFPVAVEGSVNEATSRGEKGFGSSGV